MSENKSLLGRLFGLVWAVAIGIYRLFFILSFVVVGAVLWIALHGGSPVKIEDNVALVVAPTGVLVEQIDRDPGQEFVEELSGDQPKQTLVRDVTRSLEAAASDPRISLAVIKLEGLWSAGLPQLEEVAAAMKKFQAAGKKLIAYGPWYDQSQYFAAAQADEVVLDPLGMVALEGFSSYQNYFKEGLDKIGIQVNVFRVGEYKSAVEPFTRNDMSEEAKSANREWLSDLWHDYTQTIARARKLPDTAADDYVKNMRARLEQNNGDSALYAKQAGLVTHVETLTAFRKRMGAMVGFDDNHGSFRQINFHDYLRTIEHENGKARAKQPDSKIGLVVVQGEIVDGQGDAGYAGGETISDLLDEARRDASIAAVVLRVDSPGGSVWASEQIRRAVQNLKADGKPVVASMSSVAASGGYWVSMDADEIWAHPSTITGSIGIFGMIPTIDKPLAKLGIHTDGVGTTPLAGAFRIDRPLSPDIAAIIQSQINKGYKEFIEGVAAARKLPVQKVNEIARGRVWSGADAVNLGLVDHTGGLAEAEAAAAKLAGLEPEAYELKEFLPERSFASKLVSRFSGSIKVNWLPGWAEKFARQSDLSLALKAFNDPNGIYAHCFCTPSLGGRTH